jgi:hypothetical protein
MEKFILISKLNYFDDGSIGVTLYPENVYLSNKIAYSQTLDNKQSIETQVRDLITLYTPLFFYQIQEDPDIPNSVKESIYL